MSSEHREPSQIPTNKLYVNLGDIRSTVYDQNFSTVAWNGATDATTLLQTAGSAVLRDMGKTVYLPAGSTSATTSTMLRKVQLLVPTAPAGVAGGNTGSTTDYFTGYIQLGGMTYGGGNGTATRVARLN